MLDDSNSTSGTITYDGSAIVVDSREAGYVGNVNINITGGTVESYYSTAIREIGEQDKPNMTQLTKLNVIGGSVLGASKNPVNVKSDMLVRDISVNNVSVSGGTFNHAVPEDYCAEGYVPAENGDGTFGVKKVETPAKENKKLSIDFGNGQIEIRTGSQLFTYISHFTNAEFEKNLNYTATYEPYPNHVFLYWLNESGRIISEQANYSFYLTYDTKLSAMSFTVDNSKRYVVFRDMNDKVLHSSEYTVDGNGNVVVDVPVTSAFTGFVFENWVDASGTVLTVENGKITIPAGAANKAIMIKAKYRSADTEYTVTVNGNALESKYTYGSSCTVIADPEKTEGEKTLKFAHWEADGKIVSYNREHSFIVTKDVALTAVYQESVADKKLVLNISVSKNEMQSDNLSRIVAVDTSWSLPEGFKLSEVGIVFTFDNDMATEKYLNTDSADGKSIFRYTSVSKELEGTYFFKVTLSNAYLKKTLSARAYCIYTNDSGETIVSYSDSIVQASAN